MFNGVFPTKNLLLALKALDKLPAEEVAGAMLGPDGLTVHLRTQTQLQVVALWTAPGHDEVQAVRFNSRPWGPGVSTRSASAYLAGQFSTHPVIWVHCDGPASLLLCSLTQGRHLFLPEGEHPPPYLRPRYRPTSDQLTEFAHLIARVPEGSRARLADLFHQPSPYNWARAFEDGCLIRQADGLHLSQAIGNVHPGVIPGSHHPYQPWSLAPSPAHLLDALRDGLRPVGDFRVHVRAGLAALRARGLEARWDCDSGGSYLRLELPGGLEDHITAAGHNDPWPTGNRAHDHRGWSWSTSTWDGIRTFRQPAGTDPAAMAEDFAAAVKRWIDQDYPQILAAEDAALADKATELSGPRITSGSEANTGTGQGGGLGNTAAGEGERGDQ